MEDDFLESGFAHTKQSARHQRRDLDHSDVMLHLGTPARYPVAFFPDGIGDHFHCLPAIRALAAMFAPRLRLIGHRRFRAIFFPDLSLGPHCELDEKNIEKMASDIGRCDFFLSLDPDPESELIDRLLTHLSRPVSIGWSRNDDVTLKMDETRHFSDQVFDVPSALGARWRIEELAYPPPLPLWALDSAKHIRSQVPLSLQTLVVHGETHPAKTWDADRFQQALDTFLDRHPDFWVFAIGQTAFSLDRGQYRTRVVPCHGLPLATSLALTSMADVFLGADSCMLHAADIFDVPAVGLFSDFYLSRRWGCRFGRHIEICGRGTMDSICEREVIEALETMIVSAKECDRPTERSS